MASGSLSVGGTAITDNLFDDAGESGIVPVTSLAPDAEGIMEFCGMATEATPSALPEFVLLKDCRPIGVGEVIEGAVWAGIAGLAPLSAGEAGDDASPEFSMPGIDGGAPVSSSVMAILNVPSTITTTLAPTSSERIFDVMVDDALA
jgi:hypothetical protein